MTTTIRAAALCAADGHDLAADGWRMCACNRSIADHADTAPDPAGDDGCGMTWRVCSRCAHIDEHHITEHDITEHDDRDGGRELVQVQPGGHLRQDVPAGLALPNHQQATEENAMVEPNRAPPTLVPPTLAGGAV